MRKIDAVNSFAENKNSVIFGDQGNNLMAQIESYNMVNAKWSYNNKWEIIMNKLTHK